MCAFWNFPESCWGRWASSSLLSGSPGPPPSEGAPRVGLLSQEHWQARGSLFSELQWVQLAGTGPWILTQAPPAYRWS